MNDLNFHEAAIILAARPEVEACEVRQVEIGGTVEMVAFVALARHISPLELRELAWEQLGERAPSIIFAKRAPLEELIDQWQNEELREPRTFSRYVPPLTDDEIMMATLWAEVLKVPRVSLVDDFLELGGDSLAAISLIDEIEERLGIEIPLESFFDAPTIRSVLDLDNHRGR